ncbi:ribonuclease P protein subunit [Candidatus Woesearchaeota archaeon]|nr:ribonuclease P protein subunit [Candidatus Woesearchaeota archaeon]
MVNSTPSFPHELIGKEITITRADNPSLFGITGKVMDETKFTLKVKHGEKIKVLLKRNITFKIGSVGPTIEGRDIAKKPEERLKG